MAGRVIGPINGQLPCRQQFTPSVLAREALIDALGRAALLLGDAVILTGIILFVAGCIAYSTGVPYLRYTEPRGQTASWAVLIFLVIGLGTKAFGAVLKAVGMDKKEVSEPDRS